MKSTGGAKFEFNKFNVTINIQVLIHLHFHLKSCHHESLHVFYFLRNNNNKNNNYYYFLFYERDKHPISKVFSSAFVLRFYCV